MCSQWGYCNARRNRPGLEVGLPEVGLHPMVKDPLMAHRVPSDETAGFHPPSVRLRRPDADVLQFALEIVHEPAWQAVSIENTPMFVELAEGLKIRSIRYTDCRSACAKLGSLGLTNGEGAPGETC
jgi:hypothetical protein